MTTKPTALAIDDIPDGHSRRWVDVEREQDAALWQGFTPAQKEWIMSLDPDEIFFWRKHMDIYRELYPKVRPGIEGPYRCNTKIDPTSVWVPLFAILIMLLGAVVVWGRA